MLHTGCKSCSNVAATLHTGEIVWNVRLQQRNMQRCCNVAATLLQLFILVHWLLLQRCSNLIATLQQPDCNVAATWLQRWSNLIATLQQPDCNVAATWLQLCSNPTATPGLGLIMVLQFACQNRFYSHWAMYIARSAIHSTWMPWLINMLADPLRSGIS